MPKTHQWAPTDTPEARREVAYAVRNWVNALPDRDAVLRKHYAAGVDVRDLVAIARAAGWDTANPTHIHRIVQGARADTA